MVRSNWQKRILLGNQIWLREFAIYFFLCQLSIFFYWFESFEFFSNCRSFYSFLLSHFLTLFVSLNICIFFPSLFPSYFSSLIPRYFVFLFSSLLPSLFPSYFPSLFPILFSSYIASFFSVHTLSWLASSDWWMSVLFRVTTIQVRNRWAENISW